MLFKKFIYSVAGLCKPLVRQQPFRKINRICFFTCYHSIENLSIRFVCLLGKIELVWLEPGKQCLCFHNAFEFPITLFSCSIDQRRFLCKANPFQVWKIVNQRDDVFPSSYFVVDVAVIVIGFLTFFNLNFFNQVGKVNSMFLDKI